MVVDDPAGPVAAAGLLIGGRGEQDVAAQAGDRIRGGVAAGGARLPGEQPHDAELHRDQVLHVDRAAAVDVAVGDVGRERVVGPQLRRGRDDVEVAEEEQRAAARAVAVQPGGDRAATGERLDDRRRDPGFGQDRRHVAGREDLVARRVDGRDADEVAQVGDEALVGRVQASGEIASDGRAVLVPVIGECRSSGSAPHRAGPASASPTNVTSRPLPTIATTMITSSRT